MMTIYSEISEMSISKAQQLDTHAEIYNEINQLEVKKLLIKILVVLKVLIGVIHPKKR